MHILEFNDGEASTLSTLKIFEYNQQFEELQVKMNFHVKDYYHLKYQSLNQYLFLMIPTDSK